MAQRHGTDRVALMTLESLFDEARARGDARPPLTLLAACLEELGAAVPERRARTVSLEDARDDWLRRLASANRSRSALSAYRTALADLAAFLDRSGRGESLFLGADGRRLPRRLPGAPRRKPRGRPH